MKEMKSLDLNGTKYDSFVDQTARESIEKIELTPGPQGEKGDPGADRYKQQEAELEELRNNQGVNNDTDTE